LFEKPEIRERRLEANLVRVEREADLSEAVLSEVAGRDLQRARDVLKSLEAGGELAPDKARDVGVPSPAVLPLQDSGQFPHRIFPLVQ
jgi:hypothetical protein